MNAVVQCLSNAESFSEYLVGDYYRIDRKKHCKINSRHRASKGEVTEHLANLLKCLWSRRSHADAVHRFKQVICRHGPQFGDSAQHDAQEFLLWLLDAMHEELNLSCRKHVRKNLQARTTGCSL
jgi:ubiquitin carboxyl-terminal hydrolase 31